MLVGCTKNGYYSRIFRVEQMEQSKLSHNGYFFLEAPIPTDHQNIASRKHGRILI